MVLGLVVVKLARRDNLAHKRRLRIVVAQNRAFDFPAVDSLLDQDLSIELRRVSDRLQELFFGMDLTYTYRGAKICRFGKHRIAQVSSDELFQGAKASGQVARLHRQIRKDRQPFLNE